MPAVTLAGVIVVSVGPTTWNDTPVDVAPPGFTTITKSEPVDCTCVDATSALNCVALTNVVGSAEPFHCTTDPAPLFDPATKFVPLRVNVKLLDPAAAVLGEMLASVGVTTTDPVTGNSTVLLTAPLGLITEIMAVAGAASSVAGTMAYNCVPLV